MIPKMAASMKISFVYTVILSNVVSVAVTAYLPMVINTWPFTNATSAAWNYLYNQKQSSLNSVVTGCTECEVQQCDGTVGFGGDPDEGGETTLDAMIMDGKTMNVGAVGCIRRIKNAIGVAKAVLEHTHHTLLVGELATKFAVEMGFKEENLTTAASMNMWKDWKTKNCQPNFWENVHPDPKQHCGPYFPNTTDSKFGANLSRNKYRVGRRNHDTIGMVAIDSSGNIAAGTTTNGLNHKIPGRVGDSPVMGAGSYAMNGVGGAASTGDGDIMMRFLPSFNAVSMMSQGVDPNVAAAKALTPIIQYYPSFSGAIITVNKDGIYGAACYGYAVFQYSIVNPSTPVTVKYRDCIQHP